MNYRKKVVEEVPEVNTSIWSCVSADCNGWMRDNFTFEYEPSCPLCSSQMEKDTKMLPQVVNMSASAEMKS
ncbi:hypothetical protein FHR92_000044 [Fontibacillus solani]|uniref:Cold-shock protein n=1 Tax=Fontibacillus solani TaxID=1572857 RepID=A0A7W3XPR3_9BACL|nr:cold-shock protein [Fontibacillus solani]MBA9083601.1 hypothetical protein [Fontibacillus solani]